MRGDSGVAREGRVVSIPKFYSWGKCTMPLTNINSDWMSNASTGLCIILGYIILFIYTGPLSCILGCNENIFLPQLYVQMETLGCLVLVHQGGDELRSAGMRHGALSAMDYGQPMMAM